MTTPMMYNNQGNTLLRKGVDFFYQKGAVSTDTAIVVTDADWLYIFNEPIEQQRKLLKLLTYIKKTNSETYWIDMNEYSAFLNRNKQFANRVGIAFLIFVFCIVLFGILMDILY